MLLSHGPQREDCRFNEDVLDANQPMHQLAERFLAVVDEEAARLLQQVGRELDWDAFAETWFRVVRRVVFGDAARDDARLPYADRFAPELWLSEPPAGGWPLIPFSSGPAMCPGRNLVLMLTSAMLAVLLSSRQVRLKGPGRLDPEKPLPGTFDNYALRFELTG